MDGCAKKSSSGPGRVENDLGVLEGSISLREDCLNRTGAREN